MFVSHPLIKDGTVEARLYQQVILASASRANTLVVAPTALGKTVIAVLLAAHRLEQHPSSRVLMLAPTKPLVTQHAASFEKFLELPEEEIVAFTGSTPPDRRKALWESARVICATPQVVQNDIIAGRCSLREVSLLVFDEAHRGVGDYPYAFIARNYMSQARNPRILALTASPGGDEDRIIEVVENLYIENIEVRTESDPDVRPYISGMKVEWVRVPLPAEFLEIKTSLEKALRRRLRELKRLGVRVEVNPGIGKGDLLALRAELQKELAEEATPERFSALSLIAGCINLAHALELLETQGLETLNRYFLRLQRDARSRAVKELLHDRDFLRAMRRCASLAEEMHHPKLDRLLQIIGGEDLSGRRAIVFTQYRDTVRKIVEELNRLEGVSAVRFVGQASRSRSDRGLSQKKQLEVLEKFRSGEHNVLVATSVAEEGLDIPRVDLVVFYEPIPSEIRAIQRRGRTGRGSAGRVVVLLAEKTRDEAFYWSSRRREKRMHEVLARLRKKFSGKEPQLPRRRGEKLDDFFENSISIVVDTRELSSSVVRELLSLGVISKPKRLEVGDYVLSSRVCVERKTTQDFLQSIIDGRLFEQAIALKRSYARPLILVEGDSLYASRNISPQAIRGALAAIAVDLGIPVFFTGSEAESAALIAAIARREQQEGERYVEIRGEKRSTTLREQQEFIVAGLPGVNTTLARRLLRELGSIERVFTAAPEELMRIRGIGEKTAEEIRRVITAPYEE
ncbi:MAG: DEAD/DEAH box helicase [Euryarchaeota archaeon]|nr:DEAD/DEAH box helicase [Euryarchaeota archaeon]